MTTTRAPRYRVGVIGVGRKGTQHAQAFAENDATEVVAGADPDADNLALFGKRFGLTCGLYADCDEMLAKEKLDIVCPILPVKFNPDAVVAAAGAGVRGVLCEKPMAATLADADRQVAACRDNGVWFAAGDMYRNHEQLWQARAMIEAGEIGEMLEIVNHGPANSGGGCQDLSVIRLFAGDAPVEWVTGWSNGTPMDKSLGTVDAFSDHDQELGGVIRFVNGITAHILDRPGPAHYVEVICERGVFTSDYTSFHLYRRPDGIAPARRDFSDLEEVTGIFENSITWGDYREDGWRGMSSRQAATIQSMIDALDRDIEPRASGENGRDVLELAIALRESERRGGTPVRVPLEDRSLQIIPAASRMYWKKEVHGAEWYAEQMASQKRD